MKQTASILLLAILAFNWVGYRLVSRYFEREADIAIERQIDEEQYDESSLIEFRIPLNAPYLSGRSTGFERYHGKLVMDGVHYTYVKRKIENGEVVLLCLPNEHKTRVQNARTDFFKLVNNLTHNTSPSKEKNSSSAFKSLVTEYRGENNCWTIGAIVLPLRSFDSWEDAFYSAGFHSAPEQPPQV